MTVSHAMPQTLVIGGAGGIGSAVCDELARSGHDAVAVDRQPTKSTDRFVHADLSVRGQAEGAVHESITRFGSSSALVNCAGVFGAGTAETFTWADFDATIQVNLAAPIEACLAWARSLAPGGGGRVVNVASAAGIRGSQDISYTASKAGLVGASASLARYLSPRGISVFTVAPGLVRTPMADNMPQGRRTDIARQTLVNREGAAEEVAALIAFLVLGKTDYMTGSVIRIDGGLTL